MAIDPLSLDFGSDKSFYVYLYRDPRSSKRRAPIYVGKGTVANGRADQHWREGAQNKFMQHILNKLYRAGLAPIVEVVAWFDDEQAAFAMEMALIAKYGRRDQGRGTLVNLTDGGEGATGPKSWSEDSLVRLREKGGEASRRFWASATPEQREAIRAAGMRGWDAIAPEERSRRAAERNRIAWASYTPEERARRVAHMRAGHAKRPPEERTQNARNAALALAARGLNAGGKGVSRWWASLTPEQRKYEVDRRAATYKRRRAETRDE